MFLELEAPHDQTVGSSDSFNFGFWEPVFSTRLFLSTFVVGDRIQIQKLKHAGFILITTGNNKLIFMRNLLK
jgi:hypothetical protein